MSFFEELKRRNVIRVGIAYVIVAWLILQFADVVLNNIEAPHWVFQVIMLVLGIGLPLALFFAWAFEMTPEGIKKEKDIERSESITNVTGQKLNYTIIGLLVLALGYFVWQSEKGSEPFSQESTVQAPGPGDEKRALTPVAVGLEPSIAVLPFVNMSADPEQEYFSDGISEEILNVLVRVKGLKVASRTSSFTYKGENLDIPEIARQLKVSNIAEGSVRKSGNRVRITAQLINTSDDRHLWSDTFDRELTDIFAIQDEIAKAIVDALKKELHVGLGEVKVESATENLDAYELYLKARGLFLERRQLEESIALYERAVELDPAFARAWEGLAEVYAVVESWSIVGRDWDSLAMQAAKRGIDYSALGFQAESIADLKHCLEIDPAYDNCLRHLALTYAIIDEDEQAMLLFQQAAELRFSGLQFQFIQRFMSLGERLATTLVLFSNPKFDSSFPATEVLDAMEFPERDHSRGLEKTLNWLSKSDLNLDFVMPLMAAFKAYDRIEPAPFQNRWVWLRENTGFRASEYFVPFMRKTGTPAYWREKGFPPGCRPLAGEDFECD